MGIENSSSTADVQRLIELAQSKVAEQFGVDLELEIAEGKVRRVRVDMGEPILEPARIPVELPRSPVSHLSQPKRAAASMPTRTAPPGRTRLR